MTAQPPDDPPDDFPNSELPPPVEPAPPPSTSSVFLGIVVAVAAVLGVWTLVGAGICVAVGGQIGG